MTFWAGQPRAQREITALTNHPVTYPVIIKTTMTIKKMLIQRVPFELARIDELCAIPSADSNQEAKKMSGTKAANISPIGSTATAT